MHCSKCNTELEPGTVYCSKCGQEVQIVPDYDPLDEFVFGGDQRIKKKEILHDIKKDIEKEQTEKSDQLKTILKNPSVRKYLTTLGALLVCTFVCIFSYVSISRSNSYSYQLKKGIQLVNKESYEEAVRYLSKAQKLQSDSEESDIRPLLYLGKSYAALGDVDGSIELLKQAITVEPDNIELYEEIIEILSNSGRTGELNEIIDDCNIESLRKKLIPYKIEKPSCDLKEGTYHFYVMATLSAMYGTIYYTLDGTTPTEKSTVYKDPIRLKEGTTILSAIAVNGKGIESEELILTYMLDFDVSDEDFSGERTY